MTVLAAYLTKKRITTKEFAHSVSDEVGYDISDRTVDNWRMGRYAPRADAAKAIVKLTRGKVSLADLI